MYEYYPGLNAIQKGFKNIGRIDVLFTKVLKLTRNLYKKECMVFAILPILISWEKKKDFGIYFFTKWYLNSG